MSVRARPGDAPSGGPQRGGAHLYSDAVAWLEKKKLDVPPALRAAARPGAAARELPQLLALLPGLRERERRALSRHVEQCATRRHAAPPAAAASSDDDDAAAAAGAPQVAGGAWPAATAYTNNYAWADDVSEAERLAHQPAGARRRAERPCKRVRPRRIDDEAHPAHGQYGLFAARDLPPGKRVLDYVGIVCLGANEDRTSDYVCDFGEHSQFALDANKAGNEARFINDYRNTGRRANVEFRLRRDSCGELRQGVFVCDKAGIRAGEELLISYGKSFWKSRVGSDLDEFITRRPETQS
ncbi:hypothetical protein AB1Y20_015974 [Prymnesium parvum]|uniref:SET domain-containing protein n=1 Tax=Prymnesium parvum TaxID=97485 RepID=A0AB34K1S5_PRYPA